MAEKMDGNQILTPDLHSRKDEFATREKDFGEDNYRYKMDYREKSICLIINMEEFHPKFNKSKREGTNKDAEELQKIFEKMGFEVKIKKNAKVASLEKVLIDVANKDHSQRSCFVCIVLSHGEEGKFCCNDDFMDEENLFDVFKGENCKGLVGKPKLFFFQACRGIKEDDGVKTYASSVSTPSCTIPLEADILCHYSTPPGYLTWRHKVNGSWFIQSLCEMLEKFWETKELLYILTRVNYKVAYAYEVKGKKEMPCIVSKLTKDFYFKP